jgi:hypothetical protein
MTIKVLLAGGRAAGRIIDVDDLATEAVVDVIGLASMVGPSTIPVAAPATEKQTYVPSGEQSSSGYPVWVLQSS